MAFSRVLTAYDWIFVILNSGIACLYFRNSFLYLNCDSFVKIIILFFMLVFLRLIIGNFSYLFVGQLFNQQSFIIHLLEISLFGILFSSIDSYLYVNNYQTISNSISIWTIILSLRFTKWWIIIFQSWVNLWWNVGR